MYLFTYLHMDLFTPVFQIRNHRIRKFLGLPDPGPEPLVRGRDPDPDPYFLHHQAKIVKRVEPIQTKANNMVFFTFSCSLAGSIE
jgi:hypothetical protein